MNDTRTADRPARPGTRAYARQQEAKRKRRRRRKLYFRIRQILLILIAFAIGYYLGSHAGGADAASPGASEPAPVSDTAPAAQGPADTTAPEIMGVNKLSVFLGSTVSYRSGILVSDDLDPAPQLTVDSSLVDLSAPGSYPVTYTATDSAGNTASVQTVITVVEAPETYVDESVIKETADQLLAAIITGDMTPEEQVNAVYDWIEGHCYYIAEFDKSDYMQAAYQMMTGYRGDCYGFYAVSRLLFERMGLPNLTVTRLPNETRTTNHWWNMVSLDGGETWYHYDATPHMTYPTRTCLVTDAFLNDFNLLMPNYYYFDHEAFPATPEA